MVKQIIAIVVIFFCTSAAWAILGGTVLRRTYSSDQSLSAQVAQLWGSPQSQTAPSFYYEVLKSSRQEVVQSGKRESRIETVTERQEVPIESSKVDARLSLDYRQKGLLWYSTYKVSFSGAYSFKNVSGQRQVIKCRFPLPAQQAIYDNFKLTVGDRVVSNVAPSADADSLSRTYSYTNAVVESLDLAPGETGKLTVSYDSQGMTDWSYEFGSGVTQVKNLFLTITTDFDDIDFPSGSISATEKHKLAHGWELVWRFNNLLTGYKVGIVLPKKLNPGPWVSEVTFFAPVSLFLFFFTLFIVSTIKRIRIHPMNYFFIGSGFFSFHLLMAYLVDHISVHLAFTISALVSVFLVVSYMRLVVSKKFAFTEVAISQLMYLVFFSYTFFWEKFTGLTITILSILTLFVLMQYTGRIDWEGVLVKRSDSDGPKPA